MRKISELLLVKLIRGGGMALLLNTPLYASTPVWTYSAPSPAHVEISDGKMATVQYTVTNYSKKPKDLLLKPTTGLSASPCHLAGKGSTCVLTLIAYGSQLSSTGLHTGPILCEQGNSNQCYQPSSANSLQITKIKAPSVTYTVGGMISGLVGSVALQNNGGDTLTQNTDGSFIFATSVAQGTSYNVTVLSQPATQTCTVNNGTGTISSANITNIQVICSTNSYTVGGTISGLAGIVSLQNNGGDTLSQSTDGSFIFTTSVNQGDNYNVTVSSQPAMQTCTVNNGTGTIGSANITNVQVVCSVNSYTVGGTISGLVGSVSLQNNGNDTLIRNMDGSFTFVTPVAQGAQYDVTVSSQPATQTCTVNNGTGTMGSVNIMNVEVTCSTNSYTVSGTISGLLGSVSLQNNGGDTLTQSTNGSFTFSTPVAQGAQYDVTVSTQPVDSNCTVSNGTGTMGGANVTNVSVSCVVTNFTTLGVSVRGVIPVGVGSGSVTVTNTGTNIAHNVLVDLPPGWIGVTQNASACTSIAPAGMCTITFTTTKPYVAQGNIQVKGSNISNTPTTALAFTLDGYFVWEVTDSTTVQVVDTVPILTMVPWGPVGTTNAISKTDGVANTQAIVAILGVNASYAAGACYVSTNGGASSGTWYLPAICQLGGAGRSAACAVGLANIYTNLVQLGFGGFTEFGYWSSTEGNAANAWYQRMDDGSQAQTTKAVNGPVNGIPIRCTRALNYT